MTEPPARTNRPLFQQIARYAQWVGETILKIKLPLLLPIVVTALITCGGKSMEPTRFQEFVAENAPLYFEKQSNVELYTDGPWQYDVAQARLVFEGVHSYHAEILGTFSYEDDSWLWAWANKQSNIPQQHLKTSEKLTQFFEDNGMADHAIRTFSMRSEPRLHLAIAANAALPEIIGFYRAQNQSNEALLAILSPTFSRDSRPVGMVLARALTQSISDVQISDHRRMTKHYLAGKGFRLIESPDKILALNDAGNQILDVRFDAQNRIADLRTMPAK
ncbi:MAG: hypothetical protein JNM27_02905 [Leptospirales bacterium]|nr:hypothetical protein [Leptospirales bacterium]